jgi:uncharacterized membrane protein YedE/YeeE
MSNAILMALAGGFLIGISAIIMLWCLGRITGISGIFAGAITGESGSRWRWLFLAGLVSGAFCWHQVSGIPAPAPSEAGWPLTIAAGFLVGFGTRLGGGCTSGHGVCGVGRLSKRSITATCLFMASGFATVFVSRHLLGPF